MPCSQLVSPLHIVCLLLLSPAPYAKQLPEDLDPFLEILFDKSECDDFLSDGEWVSVGTRACAPNQCDFPRQLCMRPSSKFKEEASNTCRNIPVDCLTAANDGVPLGTVAPVVVPVTVPPELPTQPPITPPPLIPPPGVGGGEVPGWGSVCDMDEPQGRFCGFQVKLTYNRHTGRCEQFFFPGCTTPDTNPNLFDSEEQCLEATKDCIRPIPQPPPTLPPPPPQTLPPSPPPIPVMPPLPAPTPPPIPRQLRPDPSPSPPTNPFPFYNLIKGVGSNNGGNMGTNQAILGLITNGISQFTGGGGGGDGGGAGGFQFGGFNLGQIPEIIRTIQTVGGNGKR